MLAFMFAAGLMMALAVPMFGTVGTAAAAPPPSELGEGIYLCHTPPGNTEKIVRITTMNVNAYPLLSAHSAHGDGKEVAC